MRTFAEYREEYRDHHATIFVAPAIAGPIEAVRREWDPAMAAQIAAHVTVAYPQEAPISDLLVERVRAASAGIPPFRLRLGRVATFGSPEDGVFVTVEDMDGGYRKIREEVLRPPFHGVAFPPHVTLVHPRTSGRGRDFRDSGWSPRGDEEFMAQEVAITALHGAKWVVLETFRLREEGERRS
jgi:2'-5' RNA ligase